MVPPRARWDHGSPSLPNVDLPKPSAPKPEFSPNPLSGVGNVLSGIGNGVGGALSGAGEVVVGVWRAWPTPASTRPTTLPGAMAMLNPQAMDPSAPGGAPLEAALPSPTDALQSSLDNILDSVAGALATATQAIDTLQQLMNPSAAHSQLSQPSPSPRRKELSPEFVKKLEEFPKGTAPPLKLKSNTSPE
ncbi:uncharacterized protein STAUR_2027 [Stigmatella aurantiaca DW4/3-1]|nr:hypothetical protein [Stigmatella aurantiaca]ADO69831.1 uncharacterized protein STAUR_2027 [Stigmatella aurantiaca DW4/3-1]